MLRLLLLLPLLLNMKPPRIPADPDYFVILGSPDSFSKDIPPSPPESQRKIGFGKTPCPEHRQSDAPEQKMRLTAHEIPLQDADREDQHNDR